MITATGWSVAQVSATPWPDVLDLLAYWKKQPPVHVLLKAFMGGESSSGDGQVFDAPTEDQLRAGIADFV